MARTIMLRLSDEACDAAGRDAEGDQHSGNRWVERLLDTEDMQRRCAAHGAWLESHPRVAATALAFHEANQRALAAAGLPNLAEGTPA